MEKKIGTITIIIRDRASVEEVQQILSSLHVIILARQGLNLEHDNLQIVTLIVRATQNEINTLTGRLGQLKSVNVKSISIPLNNEIL